MFNIPNDRVNRLANERRGVLLRQPRWYLIAWLLGIAVCTAHLLYGYLQGEKSEMVFLAIFFCIDAGLVFCVIEYFRVWYVISNEGMDFGRMFKSRGFLTWSEVAQVSYLPRKFRLFQARWFRLETQGGEVFRIPDYYARSPDFGKLILMHVAPTAIETSALPVIRAIADGWRRTSGDKWLDPAEPRTPEGPVSRVRAMTGFFVGMGVVPVCFTLYFSCSAKSLASAMLSLELYFAWPCFILFGSFGFLLFRIHRRAHLICAMVALGVMCSVTIA